MLSYDSTLRLVSRSFSRQFLQLRSYSRSKKKKKVGALNRNNTQSIIIHSFLLINQLHSKTVCSSIVCTMIGSHGMTLETLSMSMKSLEIVVTGKGGPVILHLNHLHKSYQARRSKRLLNWGVWKSR